MIPVKKWKETAPPAAFAGGAVVLIERWGEAYYNENKEKFEFLLNGGVAILYFDLLNFDKETYRKNMQRISQIAFEFFGTK